MNKDKVIKMLKDCIEYADWTCDTITVGAFFDLLEIDKLSPGYFALIDELETEGIFDEE